MQDTFNPYRSPARYFNPDCPPYLEREAILIPVWATQVTVPKTTENSLNIFERTVLELEKAGIRDADEISKWIQIAPKLARRVRKDLVRKDLLDKRGITERGHEHLENRLTFEKDDVLTGYVYQEALTGDLLQRFVLREDHRSATAAPVSSDSRYPAIRVGPSVDNAKRKFPFYIRPSRRVSYREPSNSDVFQASVRHKRALDAYSPSESSEEGDDLADLPPTKSRVVDQTINIGSRGSASSSPSWLFTYMFLPAGETDPDRWSVADPFGLGPNGTLNHALRERRYQDEALSRKIAEMTRTLRNDREGGGADEYTRRWRRAEEAIVDRFGSSIREARYFSHLTETWKELQMGREHVSALLNSLTAAQRFLEGLLQALRDAYPDEECHRRLNNKSKDQRIEVGNRSAVQIGFEPHEDYASPLPHGIATQSAQKVRKMATGNGASLRAALFYHVLAALDEDRHPFRVLAERQPDILWHLDFLAKARNQFAGHFDAGAPDPDSVEKHIQSGFQAAEILSPYAK